MKIILLSNDNYLYVGLKTIYPTICKVDDYINDIVKNENCLLLIDNREPLYALLDVYNKMKNKNLKINCLRVNMGTINAPPIKDRRLRLNNGKQSLIGIQEQVIQKSAIFEYGLAPMVSFQINQGFRELVLLSLMGEPVKSISTILKCSEKSVYRFRNALSKKMGYRNFYHACVHIFRNQLFSKDVELPRDWIYG